MWNRLLHHKNAPDSGGVGASMSVVLHGRALRCLFHRCRGRVLLHRCDAVLHSGGGRVLFAPPRCLARLALQNEEMLAVRRRLALISRLIRCAVSNHLDVARGRFLFLVHRAGENDFTISSLEIEHELTVRRFLELEVRSHGALPDRR